MEEAVLYAVKDGIATITLNRPTSLNSMNDGLIDGIHACLDKVEQDAAVRCVVLTGNGKAFCAGGDLPYLNSIATNAEKRAFIAKVGNVAKRITTIEKPFIAMINGVTAGAGRHSGSPEQRSCGSRAEHIRSPERRSCGSRTEHIRSPERRS